MKGYFDDLPKNYRPPMRLLCAILAVLSWIAIPCLAALLFLARLFLRKNKPL